MTDLENETELWISVGCHLLTASLTGAVMTGRYTNRRLTEGVIGRLGIPRDEVALSVWVGALQRAQSDELFGLGR